MRRKVLVLLLALTLVLSLMPVMSFADTEDEEPVFVTETVDETVEEDMAKSEGETEAEEVEAEVEEKASVDEASEAESADMPVQEGEETEITSENSLKGKLQRISGQHALNACSHPSSETIYNYILDECKVVDNGETHKVTGMIVLDTYCTQCGKTLEVKDLGKTTVTESHQFEDGKCICCGHKNTCKHTSTEAFYNYDEDECTIKDCGDYHKVTGEVMQTIYCKKCDECLGTEILDHTTVTEEHYYEDGKCYICGHRESAEYNTRIYGNARYDTAIKAADKYKEATGSKFENVIVADGRNFPDALSGGYLAKVKNAPILLVEPSVEKKIADYIKRNIASGGKVYILGGTGAVSSSFEKKIKEKKLEAVRLGGKTRYETNLKILKAAGVKAEDILVCTGNGYADSLSASAVGKPILLVGDKLTDAQKKYLKSLSAKKFYLIGGTGAVKTTIQTGLNDLGYKNVARLAGSTRYETSTKVANKFFPKAKIVILAYAQNFPDGLSGGPLAMLKNAPIILTDSNKTNAARKYVKASGVSKSITLGGTALISDKAVKAIMGK